MNTNMRTHCVQLFHPCRGRDEHQPGRDGRLQDMQLARHLDLQADAELFAGHHAAAERLAHRAAELRGLAA